MTEMIERVALALSIADGMHPEACSNDEDEMPMWMLYVDDARTAIEALREPTQAMLEVGEASPYTNHALRLWRQMIDAALKGEG